VLAALALSACSIEHLDPVLSGGSGLSDEGDPGVTSQLGGSGSTTSGGGDGSTAFGGDDSTSSGSGDDSTSSGGDDTSTGAPLAECVPWVRVIEASESVEELRGLAADAAGNVVIFGEFRGVADFGAGPMDAKQGQMFVAKYGPDGGGLWSRQFGSGGDAVEMHGKDAIFDAAGNVVLVGDYWGGIDFGGGTLPGSPGGPAVFVVTLDPDGGHVWSEGFAATNEAVHAESVAADATGGIVVLMSAFEPIDLGDGPVGTAGYNTFIARLADDGALVWGRSFTAADIHGTVFLPHAGFEPGGGLVVTGRQNGAIDFGGGAVDVGDESPVFVARLTPGGALEWVKQSTGIGAPLMVDVGVDGSGRIHLAGYIRDPFAFGGPLLVPTSIDDAAAVLLDGAGEHLWSERYGSGFDKGQVISALAVNDAGERLVAGQFLGTIDFGGDELANTKENTDVFVARQGPLGEHRWSRSFGGEGQMFVFGAAIDAAGDAWIAGIHDGELIIGDQVFNATEVQYQIYVTRMCADEMP
jgi:hypothetical protein